MASGLHISWSPLSVRPEPELAGGRVHVPRRHEAAGGQTQELHHRCQCSVAHSVAIHNVAVLSCGLQCPHPVRDIPAGVLR